MTTEEDETGDLAVSLKIRLRDSHMCYLIMHIPILSTSQYTVHCCAMIHEF